MKNWDELGVLRIGGTITMGNFVLPGLVSEFQKAHQNLQVHVTVSNSQNLQQALLDNRLDLALIEGGISSAEEMIYTHPIEDETFRHNNYIAWHHQKFLTDTAKDFIALCHQHSTKAGES